MKRDGLYSVLSSLKMHTSFVFWWYLGYLRMGCLEVLFSIPNDSRMAFGPALLDFSTPSENSAKTRRFGLAPVKGVVVVEKTS